MGGNVFRGVTRRYQKDEYFSLVDELTPKFHQLFSKFNVCPALKDKESFGDMDVVGVLRENVTNVVPTVHWVFGTEYVSKNGNCVSFAYKEFQVDLVTSTEAEYEFCKGYMGSGDAGNFYGKLAHMLGLKFGHDGLWLPVRLSDDHLLGQVCLTQDWKRALKFLDVYPPESFNNFQEVFDVVSASKYFNPESYLLENNNAVARVRDKKRPMYHKFLECCATVKPRNWFPRVKDKTTRLPVVFAEFPQARVEYEALLEKKRVLELYRTKFNGDLVKEWTGLENKELGLFMQKFKSTYSQQQVLDMENVQETVLLLFKTKLQ